MTETSAKREQARELVAEYTRNTCAAARRAPGEFHLDEGEIERLFLRLAEVLGDEQEPAELIDRSLRYIAFFLADCGLHGEAMKAATGIHRYRARLMRSLGRGAAALSTRLMGLAIGASWNPTSVAAYSLIVYLSLAGSLLLTSMITYTTTGETAITLHQERAPGEPEQAGVFHHLYLAAVTLTTLGYGDIGPNHRHWWGIFPATLCALGSLAGYVILAAIVAVIMNRSGIHPYARIGSWMAQYEQEVLGGPVPLFCWNEEEEET